MDGLPFKRRGKSFSTSAISPIQVFPLEIEEDVEDLEDPFSTRPPSLEELVKCTGFEKKWIMFLYRNYKMVSSAMYSCPTNPFSTLQMVG